MKNKILSPSDMGKESHRVQLKRFIDKYGLIKGRKEYNKEMRRRSNMRGLAKEQALDI